MYRQPWLLWTCWTDTPLISSSSLSHAIEPAQLNKSHLVPFLRTVYHCERYVRHRASHHSWFFQPPPRVPVYDRAPRGSSWNERASAPRIEERRKFRFMSARDGGFWWSNGTPRTFRHPSSTGTNRLSRGRWCVSRTRRNWFGRACDRVHATANGGFV